MKLEILILYDNKSVKNFKHAWGFSALIRLIDKDLKTNILFDTGGKSELLFYNLKRFAINIDNIQKIVISHYHHDHAGGLISLICLKDGFEVYLPGHQQIETKNELYMYGGTQTRFIENYDVITIENNIKLICTKEIYEQYMLISTPLGGIIITGCAHPGLDKIINYSKKFGTIYGIIGGFHNFLDIEKLEGIKFIAPCHCTSRIDMIKKRFPQNFVECAAGKKYKFEF